MSTIYALATPRAKAGLGIIRLSGPEAPAAAERLAGPLPRPRQAGLRRLRSADGTVLDEALVLLFPEGASYTGEAVVELHCHGAPAVLDAVLSALAALPGLRPAEPGEFTRRALENGRMDLAQVEGLSDLLAAETEAQRRQAWRVFDGAAGRAVDAWRADLVRALALLEASIDFVEEDVPETVWPEVRARVEKVCAEIAREVEGAKAAERLRDGFEVAIVGPPNAGKSTLLNYLAKREAAITSAVPGTTRDVLELRMDLEGLPVTFLDTAGLRDGGDAVERVGIERARQRAEAADLRIILLPSRGATPSIPPKEDDLLLLAKLDEPSAEDGVSGRTGHGVDRMVARVVEVLSPRARTSAVFTRHRHRETLWAAVKGLMDVSGQLERVPGEIVAGELWRVIGTLDAITGRVDLEHVLDDIFHEFCIGK